MHVHIPRNFVMAQVVVLPITLVARMPIPYLARYSMNNKLLTGAIGAMLLLSPLTYAQHQKPRSARTSQSKSPGVSEDMRRAIAWEKMKDRAAARQESIEAQRRRPDQSADRRMDDTDNGRRVKDTKSPGAKRDR